MNGLSVPEPHTDRTPVAQSVCRAITSAGVATLAESNFAQIDGCDDAVELRGGGVVAFYRRRHPLMFAYDTDSGTNGRLMPLVGVDSNAISLNLGSSVDATQAKSLVCYCICELKFEYREITSQTKPKICHVSYSRLRYMPQAT